MRILHILPTLSSGGVEQVVVELCEGFNRSGDEVTVISSGGRMVPNVEATGARHIQLPVRKKTPYSLWAVISIVRLLKEQKFDIVHTHSIYPTWLMHLVMKFVPKAQRPVFVRTYHTFYSINPYSAIMSKGEAVISVSNAQAAYLLKTYPKLKKERLHIIPNSIDPKEFYYDYQPSEEWLQQWKADYPQFEGKYVICLPGRVARYKGGAHLVEIVDQLKKRGIPAHGIFVGETKARKVPFRKRLLKKISALGLDDSITWLGLRSDVREIFSTVDVVVSLSIKPETFGKTGMETLALGRPFAGYQHGGIGEQLEHVLPEGRCRDFDIDHMVEILESWYHRPVKPSRDIPDVYMRETMIQSHRDLYQKLIDEHVQA